MQGRSHATIGAAFGLAAGLFIDAPVATQVVMLGAGAFGGLLPDIDTHSSILGKRIPKWIHEVTPGHRGITHSLLFCAIVYWLAYAAQVYGASHFHFWTNPGRPVVPIALAVGAFSHLVADGMTTRGVAFLYPIRYSFKLLGPFNFATGSPPERVAVLVILALTGSYVLYPLVEPRTSELVSSPPILGVPTRPILVFLVIAAAVGIILCLYSLSKRNGRRRSRRSTSRRRRPVRRRA